MRTHWSSNKAGDSLAHNLVSDIKYFNISGLNTPKNPKFFLVQSLVKRGFRARNLALFVKELKDRNMLKPRTSKDAEIDPIKRSVEALTPEQYLEILECIYNKVYTAEAWAGVHESTPAPGLAPS
ncbi:unnamed protein product [Zymoseptoria tritici ST99CH_1E4]|uniref:Uncharacterized protein n=1 Tax=Zymoseptoria tritici ST99CH_1E4 TaxID=1276532 RepID=A0A2H1H8N2_ZYMTR|nr:unnamed protein product [Zymoseptoria tritici ST99CH_1E4]